MRRLFISYLMLTALALMASAQVRVSLLTVGQGQNVWTLEGHTALRVDMPGMTDEVFNWGTFDFYAPNFAVRFIKGQTDYYLDAVPYRAFLASYGGSGRSIVEQTLDLNQAQTERLLELVSDNMREENRVYRYKYFSDNCATRPLAIIEAAVEADGSRLVLNDVSLDESSYRRELAAYHRYHPSYQLFIDLVLGSDADAPIDNRQRAFAPMFLEQLIQSATIVAPDGSTRKLVIGDPVVVEKGAPEPPREGGVHPWLVVVLIAAITGFMTWRDWHRQHITRWYDCVLFSLYGLLGLFLTFMIFCSVHEATSPNINYLWANPLCLLIPLLCITARTRRQWLPWAYAICFALGAVYIIGWPLFHQAQPLILIVLSLCPTMRAALAVKLDMPRLPERLRKVRSHK